MDMLPRFVPFVFLSACVTQAPTHYVAPPSSVSEPQPIEEMTGGRTLDVELGPSAEPKIVAEGFPAVSTDGRVAVAIQELGDGMRGFPSVVLRVFDATKGGAPTQTLQIIDVSDTADRPEDVPETQFVQSRVKPRLAAVRTILRDKRWIPLAAGGLEVAFQSEQLRVIDSKTHRPLHTRHVGGIDQKECVFEPYEPKALSDPTRRFVLEQVSYRSGPDWCNMDDDLTLIVVR